MYDSMIQLHSKIFIVKVLKISCPTECVLLSALTVKCEVEASVAARCVNEPNVFVVLFGAFAGAAAWHGKSNTSFVLVVIILNVLK